MTPKKKPKPVQDDRSVRLLRVTKPPEAIKKAVSKVYTAQIVDEAERIIDTNTKKRNMPSFIRADTTALSHKDKKPGTLPIKGPRPVTVPLQKPKEDENTSDAKPEEKTHEPEEDTKEKPAPTPSVEHQDGGEMAKDAPEPAMEVPDKEVKAGLPDVAAYTEEDEEDEDVKYEPAPYDDDNEEQRPCGIFPEGSVDNEMVDPSCIYESPMIRGKRSVKGKKSRLKPETQVDLKSLAKRVKDLRKSIDESWGCHMPKDDKGKLNLICNNINDAIWIMGLDKTFTYFSPSVIRQLGFTSEEAQALKPSELMTSDSLEAFNVALERVLGEAGAAVATDVKNWTLELELNRKDGLKLWTEARMTFIHDDGGKPSGILGVSRDITERKQAEESLRDVVKRYLSLYETSKDGLAFTNMDGKVVDANKAYLDLLGYSLEEIQELPYHKLTPEKWHEMERDIMKNHIAKYGYSEEYDKEYIAKDGRIVPISIRVWVVRDNKEQATGFWAHIRNISKQKQMEEKLMNSEHRLRLITENTSDLIAMTDLTGKIEFANPAHRKMLYADEDLIGTNYFELIHPDDQEEFLSFMDGVMMDQQDKVGTMTEYRIRDKTGNYKLVETALNVSKTHKGKRGIIVLISRFVFQ